ncbi:MAG: DUF4345 family protein [Pseudomonadota bacterium]
MAADIISIVGLVFGALLGLAGFLFPGWIANVLKLEAVSNKPGGFAEFRGTIGGYFLGTHLVALYAAFHDNSAIAWTACFVVGAGWIFTGAGRVVSMIADRTRNGGLGMNPVWAASEFVVGLAIGAPFLQHIVT